MGNKKLPILVILSLLHNIHIITSSSNCDIFILAGQSNMAGRGGVESGKWNGIVPPESGPNPRILRLNVHLQWEEARDPLHEDIDVGKVCGVGPGMAFANAIINENATASDSGMVGLVPCAVGGSRIGEWARGRRLYGQLVTRAKAAVSGGGAIRGVLWFQGESDTVRREDAECYKRNFGQFIHDFCRDLDLPRLPVIQVAIASGEGKYTEIVRRAQLSIDLPNVKCVDAKGLGLKTDHLHLTTTSEVHLGLMLAHAYLSSFAHMHS